MDVPATALVLIGATAHPNMSWIPLLLANALVGFAHMAVERRAWATQGGRVLGVRHVLNECENWAMNVATHVVLTAWAVRRCWRVGGTVDWDFVWGVEGAGQVLLDVDALYPSEAVSLCAWRAAHAGVVGVLWVMTGGGNLSIK